MQSDMNTNFQQMETWLNQHKITEIECLVPDFTGVARGKILPRNKFTEDRGIRIPDWILGTTVTGNYPDDEDIEHLISLSDRDMVLVPSAETLCKVPWAIDPTAQVIHDCYDRELKPVSYAPRNVLRKVIALFHDLGLKPICAPEVEFYLVAKNEDSDIPLRPPVGRSGRSETSRQGYSIDAVNEFDPIFEDLYDYCAEMNLDLDTLIHETGAGQMEVNFLHGDPLRLADNVFYFKRVMREVALRHNMYATFMAKPMTGEPGSAMHIHQSLVGVKTGINVFSTAEGENTATFRHFIGGLQRFIPAATLIFAPYVNSYRRLAGFYDTPFNVGWGTDNRRVGLRVPFSNAAGRRIENRIIGSDANPYLAMAASLVCGYLGMKHQIEPATEIGANDLPPKSTLPTSLREAVSLLKGSDALVEALGKEFCWIYSAVKQAEYNEFMKVISPWEREHLLLHV
jgi:glutamine synthetase